MVMSLFNMFLGSSTPKESVAEKKEKFEKSPVSKKTRVEDDFVILPREKEEKAVEAPQKNEEEEEEPLYQPPVVHVYASGHPDERPMAQGRSAAKQKWSKSDDEKDAHDSKSDNEKDTRSANKKQRRERHSANVKSSINRNVCQKKGGAGGNFTWTGANKLNVDGDLPSDYMPGALAKQVKDVCVLPAPVPARQQCGPSLRFKMEEASFPALGGKSVVGAATDSPSKAFWRNAVREDAQLIPAM